MARPRKSPHLKNQPITISLPPNMIATIDEELSYKANRSLWIQGAINLKLKGEMTRTNNQIAASFLALLQRQGEVSENIMELIIKEME
tara:strand:+ start:223 stop:486 length:264 start_codon:yes stop_codon:yes gene_type:complete